jgi:hypothetical protein
MIQARKSLPIGVASGAGGNISSDLGSMSSAWQTFSFGLLKRICGTATWLFGFCVSLWVTVNFEKIAEAEHWNTVLAFYYHPLISWLLPKLTAVTGNIWFWFVSGISLGFALGIWVSNLLAKGETKNPDSLNAEQPKTPEIATPKSIPPEERQFLTISVDELMQIFERKTDAQAQRRSALLRLLVEVIGPVERISR